MGIFCLKYLSCWFYSIWFLHIFSFALAFSLPNHISCIWNVFRFYSTCQLSLTSALDSCPKFSLVRTFCNAPFVLYSSNLFMGVGLTVPYSAHCRDRDLTDEASPSVMTLMPSAVFLGWVCLLYVACLRKLLLRWTNVMELWSHCLGH